MKQTEAQLRASKKYHEKLENIQLRVPKGEKGNISESASISRRQISQSTPRRGESPPMRSFTAP